MSGKSIVLKLSKGVSPPPGYVLQKELRNVNIYQKRVTSQADVDELSDLMQSAKMSDPSVEVAIVNTNALDGLLATFGEMRIGGRHMKKSSKSRRHKSRRHKSRRYKTRKH